MTTVPSTTPAPSISAPSTSTPGTAGATQQTAAQQLSGNFDTFLTLLTTQLQNQDPMNPMDSNQFTQELVQFSGVEQQIDTNQNLQSLISLQQGNANSSSVDYLGKTITLTSGAAALQDGDAKWSYALGTDSTATTLTVTDANGKVVYSQPGETTSGQHDFEWNGEDANGNQLADGSYTLAVNAQTSDGTTVQTAVASKGVVSEVNFTGSQPYLMIGSMAVPLSSVSAIDQTSN